MGKYGKTNVAHTHPGGILCSPSFCGSHYYKNPKVTERAFKEKVNRRSTTSRKKRR